MSQSNRHLHVDSNQKVLSLLISSEHLCSTGSCQGDESCTSQKEARLLDGAGEKSLSAGTWSISEEA